MILLTIGTQLPFDRLVEMMDKAAPEVGETIFGQIGKNSKYTPGNFEYCESLRPIEFEEKLKTARVIVSHAGIGSILTARKYGKPIIVVPRLAAFGEHRNDHQLATCNQFRRTANIYVAESQSDIIRFLTNETINTVYQAHSDEEKEIVVKLRDFFR
jgi:UDP-N-acetylglucosamine transferase subunit ALG13